MSAVPVPVKSSEKAPLVYFAAWGPVPVPTDITTLEAFRRWAKSDEFPRAGRFSFLGGQFCMDLSMEELFTHNVVKGECSTVLHQLVKRERLGFFFHDRAFVTHVGADLSTEPDGMFVAVASVASGRVAWKEGTGEDRYIEVEGAPDMVLEVLSRSSVRKDTDTLRSLYYQAGVTEYWLVDARDDPPRFDLLHRGPKGYIGTRRQAGGWVRSGVFGRSFRFLRSGELLGRPEFTLEVRT